MSQHQAQNTKRRPPGEKPTDDRKDADWGFDSDEADPSIEKKLGIVLVLCLLAGFSFVLYQKYQLLHGDGAVAATGESSVIEPASHDETRTGDDSVKLGVTSLAESTQTTEGPFYETPSEPTPTPAVENSWTLTQADTPQQSLAPTPAAPTRIESPLEESFDPFAQPQDPTDVPTAPDESLGITWDDPPSDQTPPQAEPVPLPPVEQEVASSETSLFTLDEPPVPATPSPEPPRPSPEPAPADEPMMFVYDEPQATQTPADDEAPPRSLEPLPEQAEPQPFEASEPAMPVVQEPASESPPATTPDSFDPFSFAEPQPQEIAAAPPPSEDDFSFPVPSAQDELPRQPEAPAAVTEPPAWPFAESAQPSAAITPIPPSTQTDEPQVLTFAPSVPAPTPEPPPFEGPPSLGTPPTAFSFDDASARPIVSVAAAAQAVIGEREVVVTPSDNFWSISQREYGSARYFTALARYNRDRVSQPERLQSGMKIRIPPPEVLETQFPELFQQQQTRRGSISPVSGTLSFVDAAPAAGLFIGQDEQPRYRVGERDTLSSISQQHLGRASRWTEIYELNRDQMTSPSTLKIGMVLKLPADASGVSVSPAGGFSR